VDSKLSSLCCCCFSVAVDVDVAVAVDYHGTYDPNEPNSMEKEHVATVSNFFIVIFYSISYTIKKKR